MLNKFYSLLILVSATHVYSEWSPISLKDEKVIIFFHCDLKEGERRETIEDILFEEKEKSLRELGSVFYFHFPIKMKNTNAKDPKNIQTTKTLDPKKVQEEKKLEPKDDEDFKIRSGFFQVKEEIGTAIAFVQFTKPPIFTLHFTKEAYEKVNDHDSRIPSFIFLKEQIPNQFRYFGNTYYISCPEKASSLGKLTIYLREAQIIRKNLEYVALNENQGDF